jgi:3-phenylpropionate/cinnamic acid dioxygenase small subunit
MYQPSSIGDPGQGTQARTRLSRPEHYIAGVDVHAISDKLEIRELLYRYARAVDTQDWALLSSVFTADAHLDYTSVDGPAGPRDDVVGWLERSLTPVPMTQHFITNIEIELHGDRAKVRAMFYNPMQLPGLADLSYCGGNYVHDLVRTGEGWKSERLVEDSKWFVHRPGERP